MKSYIHYIEITHYPIYVGFTTKEKDFIKEMKRLGVTNYPNWVTDRAGASTHSFYKDNQYINIICVDTKHYKPNKIQLIAIIVHEVVHVWQNILEAIGETNPGKEIEAYTIQSITQQILEKMKLCRT